VSIARAATWLTLARSVQEATSLLLPIILTRTLTRQDFGHWKQVDLAAALIVPFVVLGFDKSTTYYIPRRERERDLEVSTTILVVLLLIACTASLAFLLPGVFERLLGTSGPGVLTVAILAVAFAESLSFVSTRIFLAIDAAKTAALVPVAIGFPQAVSLTAVALCGGSLRAILGVLIAFSCAHVLLIIGVLIRRRLLRWTFRVDVLRRHLTYGGILAVLNLAQTWARKMDRFLVSAGLGAEQYAVYAIGRTRVPFFRILPLTLGAATAPRFSLLESQQKSEEMAKLWRKSVETLLPLSLLVAACLSVTAPWSIPLVFTDRYVAAVPVFQIVVFSLALDAFVGLEQILRALAALRFLFLTVMLSLLLRIGGGLAALKWGSLPALAGLQVLVSVLVILIRLVYVRRRLGVSWTTILPRRGLWSALALSTAGVVLTWVVGRHADAGSVLTLALVGAIWFLISLPVIWKQRLWRGLRR
jgi:O-antigen/teichoic acid export membrane protein